MATRIFDDNLKYEPVDGTHGSEHAVNPSDEDHSLLEEDPLTGLPWTETLLPLVKNWAGASVVHAVCLHFVGLGILANLPEFQSSHSLLREATERLAPLMGDDDRLTRFSGNKLLLFSKRSEGGVRELLVEIADRLDTFGTEIEGRHLPEIRLGMAMLDERGSGAVSVDAMNGLMSDAAGATVPMAEVVTPRDQRDDAGGPPPASEPPAPQALPEPLVASTAQAMPAPPAAPRVEVAPKAPTTPAPAVTPETSDQPPETGEEMETTMIIRGHPERTPIRPVGEPHAPAAVSRSAPHSDQRLILKAVDLVVTGLVATAIVDLDFEGRRVRGKAIGRSAEGHHTALVGEAITRAVTDLLPAGHGAVFRQAVSASTEAADVVVTVVEFLTPDSTELLFGVAPTEGEPVAGVAKSVLNAVNRPTAWLLEAAG